MEYIENDEEFSCTPSYVSSSAKEVDVGFIVRATSLSKAGKEKKELFYNWCYNKKVEDPDNKHLMDHTNKTLKVVVIFGVVVACRWEELVKLSVEDIVQDMDYVLILKKKHTHISKNSHIAGYSQ